ncbi:MAG TPA: heparan-alpha-glucosaminide N-acetyltransferase domain-containing protein [Pyrinomonadaceae bacterium]|jgi:uncharacterized membrane protein
MTALTTLSTPVQTARSRADRIISLDVMRGLVMVLMAVDHVRVYSGVPAGSPIPGIFFTRWITHFCAPAFVFFAGTGAFLHGRKLGEKRALARYLVTRGVILVVLELTVIRFAWTFNFDYAHWVLAGVIWMLGWCMIMLAALVWLPTWAIGTLGLLTIVFQQVFSLVPRVLPESLRNSVGWIWEFVYPSGLDGPQAINILYVLVPWIGVMAIGYAFGAIMICESAQRRRLCLKIGLSATALFLVAGVVSVLLRPAPANAMPALFRLLNQVKYPPSLLFLLMTLGPTIALLPLAERERGWFAGILTTFGRVPLFYYLLHIPVIHIVALLVWYLRVGSAHSEYFRSAPHVSVPPEQRWGLPLLYLVFVIVVTLLYFPCRWFASVKARRQKGWLSYL